MYDQWSIYELLKDRSRYSDVEVESIVCAVSLKDLQEGVINYLFLRGKLEHH